MAGRAGEETQRASLPLPALPWLKPSGLTAVSEALQSAESIHCCRPKATGALSELDKFPPFATVLYTHLQ